MGKKEKEVKRKEKAISCKSNNNRVLIIGSGHYSIHLRCLLGR